MKYSEDEINILKDIAEYFEELPYIKNVIYPDDITQEIFNLLHKIASLPKWETGISNIILYPINTEHLDSHAIFEIEQKVEDYTETISDPKEEIIFNAGKDGEFILTNYFKSCMKRIAVVMDDILSDLEYKKYKSAFKTFKAEFGLDIKFLNKCSTMNYLDCNAFFLKEVLKRNSSENLKDLFDISYQIDIIENIIKDYNL